MAESRLLVRSRSHMRIGVKMRLTLISDTHNRFPEVPEADILIHAGDGTMRGSMPELKDWAAWFKQQKSKFKHMLFISGNHDFGLEHFMKEGHEELVQELFYPAFYLRDSSINIEGVNFYGSPWQPRFCDWAFNADRGLDIKQYWDMIYRGIDVLISHGPPMGILDWVGKQRVGCADLRLAVQDIQPAVHVFGHIHGAYGSREIGQTKFFNASMVGEDYKLNPKHKPWVLDYDGKAFTEVSNAI